MPTLVRMSVGSVARDRLAEGSMRGSRQISAQRSEQQR